MTARANRIRLVVGAAGVLLTTAAVERDSVGATEAAVFRRINDLPDALFVPAWIVMQSGTLAAAPVSASVAYAVGRRRLAAHLLVGGSVTWATAKLVKRRIRRPRPNVLLPGTRCRGREATGRGYVSGHAGVAVALAAAAYPELGPRGRVVATAVAPLVGLSRIYVGAHLPLDVVGGAAVGLLVDVVVDAAGSYMSPSPETPRVLRQSGTFLPRRRS